MNTGNAAVQSPRKKYAARASSARRKQEILEATRVLLSEQGYDQLSLRKVAAEAGIHLKTLQYYFPNKEELIRSVYEHTSSIYLQASEKFSESNDADEGFEEYIRFLLNDDKDRRSAGFFYQLWARAHTDKATNKTMHEMYRKYTATIERLVFRLSPHLSKRERLQRAVMIGALIEGMMLYIGYGKERPDGIGNIESELMRWCKKLARDK